MTGLDFSGYWHTREGELCLVEQANSDSVTQNPWVAEFPNGRRAFIDGGGRGVLHAKDDLIECVRGAFGPTKWRAELEKAKMAQEKQTVKAQVEALIEPLAEAQTEAERLAKEYAESKVTEILGKLEMPALFRSMANKLKPGFLDLLAQAFGDGYLRGQNATRDKNET